MKKRATKNHMETQSAVMPVRPPSRMPLALSMNAAMGLLPIRLPTCPSNARTLACVDTLHTVNGTGQYGAVTACATCAAQCVRTLQTPRCMTATDGPCRCKGTIRAVAVRKGLEHSRGVRIDRKTHHGPQAIHAEGEGHARELLVRVHEACACRRPGAVSYHRLEGFSRNVFHTGKAWVLRIWHKCLLVPHLARSC